MAQASEPEAPLQTNARKTVSLLIFSGVLCWGVFGSLSFISRLKFILDGLDWSVGQTTYFSSEQPPRKAAYLLGFGVALV